MPTPDEWLTTMLRKGHDPYVNNAGEPVGFDEWGFNSLAVEDHMTYNACSKCFWIPRSGVWTPDRRSIPKCTGV